MELSNQELLEIDGGAISAAAVLGIAAGAVFIIGAVDGYVRPLKCN